MVGDEHSYHEGSKCGIDEAEGEWTVGVGVFGCFGGDSYA